MTDVYRQTVLALKHFTDARRRLDTAEERWDHDRYVLRDKSSLTIVAQFFRTLTSDSLGEVAREFLSAHNAYKELGSSLNYRNNDGHYPECLQILEQDHPCFCKIKID